MPSRGVLDATAVTSSMVSPERITSDPFACSATCPVSTVSVRPASCVSNRWYAMNWCPPKCGPGDGVGLAARLVGGEVLGAGTRNRTRAARKRQRHREPRARPQRLTTAGGVRASTGYRCGYALRVSRRNAHAGREPSALLHAMSPLCQRRSPRRPIRARYRSTSVCER